MKTKEKQSLIDSINQKQIEFKNEPFIVIIKLPSQPHNFRVTYAKYKSNKVTSIEEIDSLERLITSSEFKGKSCNGFCSADIKNMKGLINQIKPNDWIISNDYLIDAFYKQH